MKEYLSPTEFLDFNAPSVRRYAFEKTVGAHTATEKAVKLYYAVRDDYPYNPYVFDLRRAGLAASRIVEREQGYCVEKAVLLAAAARVVGIPSRLSFCNVRNHLATERLEKILQTDVLVFHGAAELFLDGRWLKATPAFDADLCRKLNVAPLEFDGRSDSVFQQRDALGNVFMEYLDDYGNFADLPYELYLAELRKHYPHVHAAAFADGNLVFNLLSLK